MRYPNNKEECEASGLQWVIQGKDGRTGYCRKKQIKSPIEYYWNSPLSKHDMSVPIQKKFKQTLDQNPEIVDSLMEV